MAIYKLCQSIPVTAQGQAGTSRDRAGTSRDKTGTNKDKQGQTGKFPFRPCLSLPVPVCACLSLLVPVCPCMSLFVPNCSCLSLAIPVCPCLFLSVPVYPCLSLSVSVCLYIFNTFMSTPADEYTSLHQYEHSYLVPCKRPLFQCMQTLFLLLLYFSYSLLNNSFI